MLNCICMLANSIAIWGKVSMLATEAASPSIPAATLQNTWEMPWLFLSVQIDCHCTCPKNQRSRNDSLYQPCFIVSGKHWQTWWWCSVSKVNYVHTVALGEDMHHLPDFIHSLQKSQSECLEKLVTTSKDWKAELKFWSHIVHIIHQLAISGQSTSRRYMYTMYRLNHYQAYQIHKTIATFNTPPTTPIIPPVQLCLYPQYQLTGWDSLMASVCNIAMHTTWGIADTNYHVEREAKLLKNHFNECWSENEEEGSCLDPLLM